MGAVNELKERLTAEKDRAGIGIAAFEKRLGLKRSTINSIISGKDTRVPSIEKVERIANALGWEVYVGPPRNSASAPMIAPKSVPEPANVSLDDLTLAVELVERTLDRLNRELPPRRKAEAIADFYNRIEKGGMVEPATIERLMKIA